MCAEGCYNFRVSQLIDKGNSATKALLKLQHTIFYPKNCLKDTPFGQKEISLSRGFDNSEIPAERDHRVVTSPVNETGQWDLPHSNEDKQQCDPQSEGSVLPEE